MAIGCGWNPKSGSIAALLEDDFLTETNMSKCGFCFRHYTFPSTWHRCMGHSTRATEVAVVQSDSSSSSGSDSDSSNDSQSESEALRAS